MKPRTGRILFVSLGIAGIAGGTAIGAALWSINQSVQDHIRTAQQIHPHPGDDVAALIDMMNATSGSLADRNLAVWTLGRLRDSRALDSLRAAYTGESCDHSTNLCQYELEKALSRYGQDPTPSSAPSP